MLCSHVITVVDSQRQMSVRVPIIVKNMAEKAKIQLSKPCPNDILKVRTFSNCTHFMKMH